MASVRAGQQAVLLVVDVQVGVVAQAWNRDRIPAAHLVRDLNIAITWLSYPGRRNGIAPVAALDFSPPSAPT